MSKLQENKIGKIGWRIITGPKKHGERARFCVIEDPAGAVAALYQEKG